MQTAVTTAYLFAAASSIAAPVSARQEGSNAPTEERLDALERENAELRRRLGVVEGELEHGSLGELVLDLGERVSGLGPAASKVYGARDGVSIGGYGEALYEAFASERDDGTSSGKIDQADFLRGVFYIGSKFDETWLFNSEIEFEHASTGEEGEASVEFAYVDGRFCDTANLRTGLVLVPMGLVNELHEPTSFLSARRPGVETAILPSTWRENGVGVWGEKGEFEYRAYVLNGLDASGFTSGGIRDGRQDGSKALADDLAFVGRVDWTPVPGLVVGGSAYTGDSSQGLAGVQADTTLYEAHADARWRGVRARALYAHGEIDDVADLNAALGFTGAQSVGEELAGGYVELGYDVISAWRPGSAQSLTPFVRLERYDTQADVPTGFASDPAREVEITTYGVAYQPMAQVIFKLDFMDVDNDAGTGVDQVNVAFGYIF
jgi:hypothetical protein